MKLIVLDATTKTIRAALVGAVATSNPDFVVAYADSTDSTFAEASTDGQLNGTTDVTLVAAPGSGVKRTIKSISVYNRDTAPVIVVIKLDVSGTQRILQRVQLVSGETWHSDDLSKLGPGGSDTQVQFNDTGTLAGSSNFTYNKTTSVLTLGANPVLSAGTANGVLYLNGSKSATTGSALTFDGNTARNNQSSGTNSYFRTTSGTVDAYFGVATAGLATGVVIGSFSNNDVVFYQNSTEAMRLTSTGLGIGLGGSSPQDSLDITRASGTAAIRIASQGVGSLTWRLASQLVGVANAGFVIRDETNGVNRLAIDGSGNVGIGTNSPTQRLEVLFHDTTTNRTNPVNVAVITATSASASGAPYTGFGPALVFRSQSYNGTVYNGPRIRMAIGDDSVSTTAGTSLVFDVTATKGASPTQAAVIDPSGNLGLGVTPSAWSTYKAFEIQYTGNGLHATGQNDLNIASNVYYNAGYKYAGTARANLLEMYNGEFYFKTAGSGTAGNAITFTQAMTLDASGNLLVGVTSTGYSNSDSFTLEKSNGYEVINHSSSRANGALYIAFGYNGSGIGSITQNGVSQVLYNISSDQRLKENIQDADSASGLIDALKVRQFDWKADGSHQRYGFVAQEIVAVAPEAVHQPTDPESMMAVDYSKLVPMLIKEVQSLRARIAALEGTQP
jgi:hypothetical protein